MQDQLMSVAMEARPSDIKSQKLLRRLFGRATKFGCDKQGRILIPDSLRTYASIEKEVSLVGLGHYFQIWSAAKREEEDDDFNLLEAMAELGI
jgi:MraZ protein